MHLETQCQQRWSSRSPDGTLERKGTELPVWLRPAPAAKSAWIEQAFDVLLGEWGVAQDERVQMWEHCGEEMIITVDGMVGGSLTPGKKKKKKAIKVVPHQAD